MFGEFHFGWFGTGALFFGRALLSCATLERVPFLPGAPAAAAPVEIDAILVVAHDEGLAAALDSLRAQRGVSIGLLVVDDRSPPAIAARIAAAASAAGARLLRIDELPKDVMPWHHAVDRALQLGERELVLLAMRPVRASTQDALARAHAGMLAARAAGLWLVPQLRAGALAPLALGSLGDALPALGATQRDQDAPSLPMDLALYRRAFLAEALARGELARAPVLEYGIAQHALDTHARLRVAHAAGEFALAPRLRLRDFAETTERTLASFGLRPTLALLFAAFYLAAWLAAALGPFAENRYGLFACGGLLSLAVPGLLVARVQRSSPLAGLLVPLAGLIEAVLLLALVTRVLVRRGVRWRGVGVSLAALRRPHGANRA